MYVPVPVYYPAHKAKRAHTPAMSAHASPDCLCVREPGPVLPDLVVVSGISWRADEDELGVRSLWMDLKITPSPRKASENITTPAIPALRLHLLDRGRPFLSPPRPPPRAPSQCFLKSFPESCPPSRWSNGVISAVSCIGACVLLQLVGGGCRLREVGPFLLSSLTGGARRGAVAARCVGPCFCRRCHRG